MQTQRDRAVQELRAAEAERGKRNAETEVLEAHVAALKSQESSLSKEKTSRSEEVAALEKRRDALSTEIKALEDQKLAASRETESALKSASDASKQKAERDRLDKDRQEKATELANLQALVERLRVITAANAVDDGAAKRADAARAEAEKSLAKKQDELRKTQDELQSVQQQLLQAKGESARLDQVRATAAADDGAAKRANTARTEAAKILAGLQDELSVAEKKLTTLRAEIALLEQRRTVIAIDESATKSAEAARVEAEKARSKVQGDLFVFQKQVAEAQNELVRLERLRDSIAIDDAAARKADAARADADKRLTEARAQLDKVQQEINEETKRRNSLRSDVDYYNGVQPAATEIAPAPTPRARRSEPAPGNPVPRLAPTVARPTSTPRPAPIATPRSTP